MVGTHLQVHAQAADHTPGQPGRHEPDEDGVNLLWRHPGFHRVGQQRQQQPGPEHHRPAEPDQKPVHPRSIGAPAVNTPRNLRARFRRTITIFSVLALTALGTITGGVAFAGTADAASYSQCHPIYTANPGDGVCWVSYNWWEHMWGYQDHWEYEPGLYNSAWI